MKSRLALCDIILKRNSNHFGMCDAISFYLYNYRNCSVPSPLRAKMHKKSPSVMEFWLVCLGIFTYSCQNTSRDRGYLIVTNYLYKIEQKRYQSVSEKSFPQSASPTLRYILLSFGCRSPLRRPHSDKISHKL